MNPLSCISNQLNLGVSSCKKLPQQIIGMITTPESFSLTEVEAATSAAWQAALLDSKSNRIYYWPTAFTMENISEEAVYEDTVLGRALVRDGRYQFKLSFRENLELHKAMFSHQNFDGRVFFIDNQKKVIGTVLDNGEFAGFSIDLLNPEKLMFNTGSETSKTPVMISLEDNRELDVNGAQIDGSFLRGLTRLTSVQLEEVGTSTGTEITVSVKSTLDSVPLLGLVVADFTYSGGTINTATDNEDGTYTLAGVGLTTGSLTLVSAATLSVSGFEALAPITITIA